MILNGGILDVSSTALPLSIGSIEGNGFINVGEQKLTVGGTNRSTAFSGVMQQINFSNGCSLTKIGKGTFTLKNANTFTGGATVNAGTLLVTNTTGSATGPGPVAVEGGTLGGTGIIAGAVTTGGGARPASLAPGGVNRLGSLTLQSTLTFNSMSTFQVDVNSRSARSIVS